MSAIEPVVATLGVPRDRTHVELKIAYDAHRAGCLSSAELAAIGRNHRIAGWRRLKVLGVQAIPSNDVGLHDPVHDTAAMIGAPQPVAGPVERHPHRVASELSAAHRRVAAWFDLDRSPAPPRLAPDRSFGLGSTKPVAEFLEAKLLDIHTRPVLLGPASFLACAVPMVAGFDPLDLLPRVLPVWSEVMRRLARAGADRIEIDEPCLADDPDGRFLAAAAQALTVLGDDRRLPEIVLTTGHGGIARALPTLARLPIAGLHLDLVGAPDQLDAALEAWPAGRRLSLGVVDGRSTRPADLPNLLRRLDPVVRRRGADTVELAPATPLRRLTFHSPLETVVDTGVDDGMMFAADKIGELRLLARALGQGAEAGGRTIASARAEAEARRPRPLASRPRSGPGRVAAE